MAFKRSAVRLRQSLLKNDEISRCKLILSFAFETFTEALLRLIRERNLTEAEVYNSVFMDRRLFNKIRNDREYQPSKRSAILLAIALKLNLTDALEFLEKAGFVLSHSNRFDVIIKFHIAIGCYDVLEINEALHENNLPLLLKCD